jgi:PRTRC genetic system protein E
MSLVAGGNQRPVRKRGDFMTLTTSIERGLFSQVVPLLEHRAVLITVSKLEDDVVQVNICPRQLKEGENHALTTPLCLTGTAEELDAELVSQLATFVESHVGLTSNLAAIEQEVAEAEKAAREAAKKKHKAVGNGGRKSSDSISPKSEPERPGMRSLFDQQPPTSKSATLESPQTGTKAD